MIGRRMTTPTPEVDKPKGFDDFELRLGDLMRGERATLGKSLLDVQRELKIKATYIAAIENTDVSAFETPGFIAGYVRSYARYLGMEPDWAFSKFCRESGFAVAHGMSAAASSASVAAVRARQNAADGRKEFAIMVHPDMFEHTDRNHTVELFVQTAIVPQFEAHAVGQSLRRRPGAGFGQLFAR